MKALGPSFGKSIPKVRAGIEAANGSELRFAIDTHVRATVSSGWESFEITADHVTFSELLPDGIFSAPMNDGTVYVDVTLSPDPEAEGYAREVIRRIQEMRKQMDLRVEDFIRADVAIADRTICDLIRITWRDGIKDEVRATELTIRLADDQQPAGPWQMEKDWDVEGVAMKIGIGKQSS
ncbi:DUF5915 domain-containing protein, partial [Methanoregula sp.]|uniref:DUF5915 domain-containing protein n=1 Tax=Methanoregula sp. TaxID=2052170 RepID=UPI000CB91C2E